jgi:hypothetical protein
MLYYQVAFIMINASLRVLLAIKNIPLSAAFLPLT